MSSACYLTPKGRRATEGPLENAPSWTRTPGLPVKCVTQRDIGVRSGWGMWGHRGVLSPSPIDSAHQLTSIPLVSAHHLTSTPCNLWSVTQNDAVGRTGVRAGVRAYTFFPTYIVTGNLRLQLIIFGGDPGGQNLFASLSQIII